MAKGWQEKIIAVSRKVDSATVQRYREPAEQALGNITDFASPSLANAANAREWRTDVVSLRYQLLDAARSLLPKERVESCLRIPTNGGDIEIWQDTESGHAHFKGVGRCGSAWVCPVCAAKVSMGRRAELREGIEKARQRGWYPVFVTYTSRHTRDDTCEDMKTRTRQAQRLLKSGRWWANNVKAFGLMGTITGIEPTYGDANGWHIHYHAIYFFEKMPDLKDLENKLFERWYAVLQKQGLDCDREYGVDVKPGNHAANYVSKWGLENELAAGYKKAKDGHFTPFELLYLYDEGHRWAGAKFQEFAKAFKGVSQLRWSKGLRAALDMGTAATDKELAESEVSDNSVKLVTLSWEQYQKLIKWGGPGTLGNLLMVAECGHEALSTWLKFRFKVVLDDEI